MPAFAILHCGSYPSLGLVLSPLVERHCAIHRLSLICCGSVSVSDVCAFLTAHDGAGSLDLPSGTLPGRQLSMVSFSVSAYLAAEQCTQCSGIW